MTGDSTSGIAADPRGFHTEAGRQFKRRVTLLQALLLTSEVGTAAGFGRYFVSERDWFESLLFGIVVGGIAFVVGYAVYRPLRYPEGTTKAPGVPSPKEALDAIHALTGSDRPGLFVRAAVVAVMARAMFVIGGSYVLGTIFRLGFRPFVVVFVLDRLVDAPSFWRGVLTVLLAVVVAGCVELGVMIPLQRRWGIPIWGAPAPREEAPAAGRLQPHDVGGEVYGR